MNTSLRYILILSIVCFCTPISAGMRNEIKIVSRDCDNSSCEIRIFVPDAPETIEVLVFAEYASHSGLKLVADKNGNIQIPEKIANNLWHSYFEIEDTLMAIYAVSAYRKQFKGWDNRRDLYALKRLGIESLRSIDEVLELLFEFGWMPTGYTYVGTSNLRKSYIPFEQSNTSNTCETPSGKCTINGYSLIGTPCFCVFGGRTVKGRIIKQK